MIVLESGMIAQDDSACIGQVNSHETMTGEAER